MHEVEHFDFSEEADRVQVSDLLTDDENAILMSMVDKCEDLEFSKDPDFDACDYAFELEKCWKKSDPEVKLIQINNRFYATSHVHCLRYSFTALLCSIGQFQIL